MAILIKPKLILSQKELFCLALMIFGAMLTTINIICFVSTVQNRKQNKSLNIKLSFFQVFLGLSFGISGIALASLIFFKKISDKNAMILSSIYCGIFAIGMIVAIICSSLSKIIGYNYAKKLHNEGKSITDISQKKTIRFCHLLDNIANILLSMYVYGCHLFTHDQQYQANKIFLRERVDEKTTTTSFLKESIDHDINGRFCPFDLDPKQFAEFIKSNKLNVYIADINQDINPDINPDFFKAQKTGTAQLSFVGKDLEYMITIKLNISDRTIHNESESTENIQKLDREYIINKLEDESIKKEIIVDSIIQTITKPVKSAKIQFNFMGLYLPQLDVKF